MSNNTNELFENIKHINEYNQEFWYANNVDDHFADVGKMVQIGKY